MSTPLDLDRADKLPDLLLTSLSRAMAETNRSIILSIPADRNRDLDLLVHEASDAIRELVGRCKRLAESLAALEEYAEHAPDCILSRWEAGEPREDGYYVKYAGVWYPSDERPQCNCGLYDLLHPTALHATPGEGT
jgi:hypothetical protein